MQNSKRLKTILKKKPVLRKLWMFLGGVRKKLFAKTSISSAAHIQIKRLR